MGRFNINPRPEGRKGFHLVVYDACEIDYKLSIWGRGYFCIKLERCTSSFLIVTNLVGLDRLFCLCVLGEELGTLDLQLVCVERDFLQGLLNFDINGERATIGKLASELDIMDT